MSNLQGWARRKATRAGAGLVPVEVDIHTATGVHRAIRYHRVEDAKKMIAEGKAHEIKEMRTPQQAGVKTGNLVIRRHPETKAIRWKE